MAGVPVEICFSLDTACSISAYLNNMKEQVKLLIKKLHAKIHGVRFAIFAHGDYCSTPYITKHINFSENVDDLCEWLFMLKLTTGKDVDGCYELVLKEVQSLPWTPGSKRALVMIGNADPHESGYAYGKYTCNIDWRDETSKLMQMNIRIYGISRAFRSPKDFYENISVSTGGKHVSYDEIRSMFGILKEMPQHDNAMLQIGHTETEVHSGGSTIDKDIGGSVSKRLRRADTIDRDTVSSSPVKKRSSIKVRSPRSKQSVKTTKKILRK